MLGDIIFNGLIAVRYGITEAIILRMLLVLLESSNESVDCYEKQGVVWIRLTINQMQADLPFLSPYRIRTAVDNLIYEKLIVTDEESSKFGLRKRKTVGYALTEKGNRLARGANYDND